jgi:EAL domain-containing protein (putative c-di-GMP-specific phosphodiesterase class I)
MQWAARINNALEERRFDIFRQVILPLQEPQEHGMHYELLLAQCATRAGKIVTPDQFIARPSATAYTATSTAG